MPPPVTRTLAAEPAPPAVWRPARKPARRGAAPPRLAGKPAVRLSVGKAPRRKSGAAPDAAEKAEGAAGKEPPDPRLTKAIDKVRRNAKKLKKHDPAGEKADDAQDAAPPPEKEKFSRAQANKVGEIKSEMDAAKAPSVDEKPPQEKSFIETLEEEIERVMPQKIEDAENFMGGEDRENLKGSVAGNIEAQKQQVTGPVKATAKAKPDESVVTPKAVVTPMPEALPKAAPESVGARDAMPAPLPDEQVSLQSSKDEAQRRFDENKITPAQLQKANDPRFTAALEAKQAVDAHADAAPQKYRESEQKTLTTAVSRAVAAERRGTGAMLGAHGKAGGDVRGDQAKAMKDDRDRRQEVVNFIEGKFAATKQAVETKLATLETEVTRMFDEGIEKNIKSMKDEATRKKDAWKEDRYYSYGVMTRPDLWLYDKARGIDRQPKVKRIYVEAAEQFTRDMKSLVRRIAAFVEARLREAKDEVEKGRKEIQDFVSKLDGKLKDVGLEAQKAVEERFDELKQTVEDKKQDLASNLAQRYKDAHDKAGEAIKEMQAEDKGLVDAFLDKLKAIIEILGNFRRRIMSLLRKAAGAIDLIVSDPIGFLKNLLRAIKQGVGQFVGRIWTHLQEGFTAWLFGSLAAMGVALPKDLSPPSILQLVLGVLGITAAKIRGKVVKVVGERNAALLEAAWGAVETLWKGGPAALWEQIREYFSNLKEMVVDAIQNWLVTRIIESAATKIAMMFNPAGAIIQAIMMIYRTVMFFIENIDRILAFVESIIESVYNIATGAVGAAADWIEKALARTIPIIIAFLARLLGISGLADKIKEFINRVQSRIDKALDKVVEKVAGGVRKLVGAGKAAVAGIVEWWRARQTFKTDDGETHTLFFEGTMENADLMIASQKRSYADFIKGVTVPAGDPTLKQVKADALAEAKAIDDLKKRLVDPKLGKVQDQAIRTHLNNLAVHTKKLSAAMAADPPTVVEYGPLTSEGGGTTMTATVLSRKNRKGSRPQDKPTIWLKARRRANDFFVQGHLLNEDLGGPGRAYNLTPISNHKANTDHHTYVESQIKPLVLKRPYHVIRYHVTADYSAAHDERPFKLALKKKIKDLKKDISGYVLPADKAALKRDKAELTKAETKFDIMDYEEKNLCLKFDTEWWTLTHNGTSWVVGSNKKHTKEIPNRLPDGDFKYQK